MSSCRVKKGCSVDESRPPACDTIDRIWPWNMVDTGDMELSTCSHPVSTNLSRIYILKTIQLYLYTLTQHTTGLHILTVRVRVALLRGPTCSQSSAVPFTPLSTVPLGCRRSEKCAHWAVTTTYSFYVLNDHTKSSNARNMNML